MPSVGDFVYDTDMDELERVVHIDGVGSTSDSSAIAATETAILTLPSNTYKANSVYFLELAGMVSVSVADNSPNVRYRKTNTSGQQFISYFTTCHSITVGYNANNRAYFQVGASDVAASIVMTLTGSGSYNAKLLGSATSPSAFNVYRVVGADLSNFTYAPTLV